MNKEYQRFITIVLLAAFASLSLLHFMGKYNLSLEGLDFRVDTSLSFRGHTEIDIPPLGLVRAYTHRTPVKITVQLNNLDLEQIQQFLENNPDRNKLSQFLEFKLKQEARRYFLELIFTAVIAGILPLILLRSTKTTEYITGIIVSVVLVGVLLLATYKDYDIKQFSNPEYEGALKAAPWVVGIAQETIAKIDVLSDKLQLMAQNFNELYRNIENIKPLVTEESNFKVLHVSDIHNNPAAIQFIGRMADLFQVNLIIDTGDISDFGTPLEGLLLDRITELSVPYVFVAGNHDSPSIINKLKELDKNIIVAQGQLEISGLTIMGFNDPSSLTNSIQIQPPAILAEHVARLKKEISLSNKPVDIIAVHTPYVAGRLAGLAPILLFGHNHQYSVSEEKNSVMINAGTSGASGLGTLQETERRPYSVMLLHLQKNNKAIRLIAVDSIQVGSISGEFSMQRHIFYEPE